MRTAHALALSLALGVDPGGALAQASAPPAGTASGAAPAADSSKAAPPLMDAAKRYYDDAIKFFQEGRYDAARVAFEASYGLSHEPDLLYNLSTTAEKQGQFADAIRYAERYLEGKPNAEDAVQVRERIASLRAQQQGAPAQEPTRATEPAQSPVMPPANAAPEARPEPPKILSKQPLPILPLALLGVGGGLLLAGVGTGAGALATQHDLESRIVTYRELTELQDRGNALNVAAISLSAVGGAAVLAGGVWLAVTLSRRSHPR